MADGDLTTVVNCDLPANNQRRAATFNDTFSATPVWIDFRSLKGSDLSGTPFRPSGVHIDNTLGSGDLTINFGAIGYRIVCPANAMLNLPYPAPISDMVSVIGAGQATLIFVDYPVEPFLKEATGLTTQWGNIAGILSNQTDLQAALDAKQNDVITSPGDLVMGDATGEPVRLPVGTVGQELQIDGTGFPKWKNSDFTNPMTAPGDIIYNNASSVATALPIGTANQRLTVDPVTGLPIWKTQGFTNPMTSVGDLIVGGTAGAALRLGIGSTGQVLTVSAGTSAWTTPAVAWGNITGTLSAQTDLSNALNLKAPLASPTFTGTVNGITATMVGLGNVNNTSDANKPVSTATQTALNLKVTNPMTAVGDLIVGGSGGAPTVLVEGAAGSFLSSGTTTPVWRAVVGTVSQTGGVPTGALFQNATSGNSYTFKFADGTMIQIMTLTQTGGSTTAAGALFRGSATAGGSFMTAFVGPLPAVTFSGTDSGGGGWIAMDLFHSLTAWGSYSTRNTVSSGTSGLIYLMATGRWF